MIEASYGHCRSFNDITQVKQVPERLNLFLSSHTRHTMRGTSVIALCCALVANGAMGFVAPLSSARPSSGLAGRRRGGLSAHASAPPARLCTSMSTTSTPKFSLSLMDDTRVSFGFEKESLRKLAKDVNGILEAFKRLKANAADGGKPYREDTIEFKDTIDGLNILVECNPNIFPDPFKAQVFIRIWDDKVEISSQAMLTKLTDAIKQQIAAIKAQE